MLKTKYDLIWRFYYENKKSNAAQSYDKEQIKRIEYISATSASELLYGMFYSQTLSIDITTGDSIYPNISRRKIIRCFDSDIINVFSYPLETVLAEKIETIITRGILNTRPRDFYDVYILTKTQGYNAETLRKAIFATAEHRGTKAIMEAETNNRLAVIENSSELQSQWAKYQKKFPYAKDITYQETVNAVKEVIHEVYF